MKDHLEDLVADTLARFESEGPAAIEEACTSHPQAAAELTRRIQHLVQAGFVVLDDRPAPGNIPGFRMIRRLGGGGMGVVHLAVQEPLDRLVAIKLIRPEHAWFDGTRERFRRGAEAVAKLRHPGIVAVHTFGEEGGVPYLAMEYVEGATLAEVLELVESRQPRRLSGADLLDAVTEVVGCEAPQEPAPLFTGSWPDACCEIARRVSDALAHAHGAGVLHRDVKPSNVMVTPEGRVRLLDFGLAWSGGGGRLTSPGTHAGSLPYLPPERITGAAPEGHATQDVYGVGVMLYEMLTARLPFEADDAEEVRRRIVEARPVPVGTLNPAVPWDVATVCLVAMAPEPGRRYASAAALARDLGNALERRPIEARRPGRWFRARRWMQRHPARTTLVLVVLLVVTGVPGALSWQQHRHALRMAAAKRRVEAELTRADGLRLSALSVMVAGTDPGLALLLALEAHREHPSLEARNALLKALVRSREVRQFPATVTGAAFSPGGTRLALVGSDGITVVDATTGTGLLSVATTAPASVVTWLGDGRVVTGDRDGSVRVWDLARGVAVLDVRPHERSVRTLEQAAGGRRVVSTAGDASVAVVDVDTGTVRLLTGQEGPVFAASFDPAGDRVVTAGETEARVWSAASGAVLLRLAPPVSYWDAVRSARFSPDGTLVLGGCCDDRAYLWDADTGEVVHVLTGHEREVMDARFGPRGERVATASYDGTARLWSARDGALLHVLRGHAGGVRWVRFSPDGHRVVTVGLDHTVRLWDAASGAPIRLLGRHANALLGVRMDARRPDRFVTLSKSMGARLWDCSSGGEWNAHAASVTGLLPSPDGKALVTAGGDGSLAVWDARTSRLVRSLEGHGAAVTCLALDPRSEVLASGSRDRTAVLWDLRSGEVLSRIGPFGLYVDSLAFSRDGRRVAVMSRAEARSFDARTGAPTGPLVRPDPGASFVHPLTGPAGRSLVTVSSTYSDYELICVDLESGRRRRAPKLASPLSVDPGGGLVVAVGRPRRRALEVLQLPDLERVARSPVHESRIDSLTGAVAFSPDGTIVASVSAGGVRFWDWRQGRIVGAARAALQEKTRSATFSPDGLWLLTLADDGTAALWRARDAVCHVVLRPHEGDVRCAAFAPDSRAVWVGTSGGRVLEVPVIEDLAAAARARRPRGLTDAELARFGLSR